MKFLYALLNFTTLTFILIGCGSSDIRSSTNTSPTESLTVNGSSAIMELTKTTIEATIDNGNNSEWNFEWHQTSGPDIETSSTNGNKLTYTTPYIDGSDEIELELEVTAAHNDGTSIK